MAKKIKVLFIKAAPIKHNKTGDVTSFSLLAIDIFRKEYIKNNPDHEIQILDLNYENEIHEVINGSNIADFWNKKSSSKYINQLKEVDKVVVITPTHNWNYSGLLKQYFDLVVVAKQTFYYNKRGFPVGMLKGKKVQMIFTQSSRKITFKNHIASAKKVFKFMGMKPKKTIHIGSLRASYQGDRSIETIMKKYENKIKRKAKKF